VDLDVLERARCGDREAFRTLTAAWGDRALRTAALIIGDRARAEQLVVAAFTRVWRDLPTLHSERPFRPWLMRALLDALPEPEARELDVPPAPEAPEPEAPTPEALLDDQHGVPGDQPQAHDASNGLLACLEQLTPDDRATVVLHLYDQMGATELGLARGANLTVAVRGLRTALRALTACVEASGLGINEQQIAEQLTQMARGSELPPWFADEMLGPRLTEPDRPEVRRLVGLDPADAWARLLDPAGVPAWVQARDVRVRGAARLEPGARISARGRIAGRRPSRDETVIARADASRHTLGWTTRSRIRPWGSAIEFRWLLSVAPASAGCELIHALRGVAFPPGPSGRFLRAAYERVADAMPTSMHAGIEQLAQLLETGARRAPL